MSGALTAAVTALTLTTVNQEEVAVRDGGAHPLCQAIPVTRVEVEARTRGLRALRVAVRPPAPTHPTRPTRPAQAERSRVVRVRDGRARVAFTAAQLGGDLVQGRYRVRLSAGGRTLDRASFRLVPPGPSTC